MTTADSTSMTSPAGSSMVFGDDGSLAADLAWMWINCHAWPHWRVDVITAQPQTAFRATSSDSDGEGPERPMPWTPEHPRRPFAESELSDVTHLAIAIDARLALSRPADLLVIGRRGPGLAKALHLGSTAEWLMAHPPAPMVVARHGRPTRSVVVCHDGSTHAAAATQTLCALPWINGKPVTLVSVDDGPPAPTESLESAAAGLRSAGAEVQIVLLRGEPTHELLRHLETANPDLIVLGTRGLTGIERIGIGSTASVIVHATEASVLLASSD